MTKKINSKKMPKRVRAKAKAGNGKTFLQVVEIPEKVTLAELVAGRGLVEERTIGLHELVDNFPQLLGKRHKPVFITLATDGQDQVLQVYVERTKGKALVNPNTSVYQRKYYRLEPPICPGCGNPLYDSSHLLDCRGY